MIKVYDDTEMLKLLKIKRRTLIYLIQTRQIPFFLVGKKRIVRFEENAILAWMKEKSE